MSATDEALLLSTQTSEPSYFFPSITLSGTYT